MKLKMIVLLIALPMLGMSQSESSFDFFIGPDFSHLIVHGKGVLPDIIRESKSSGPGVWSPTIGFSYNQKLIKRLYLRTGFRYKESGWKSPEFSGLRWPDDPNGNAVFTEVQTTNKLAFIEVPLTTRWEFGEKKLSLYAEAGLGIAFYLFNRTKQVTNLESTKNTERLVDGNNMLQLMSSAAVGLNYNCSEKIQLFFQPNFRYHLMTVAKNAPVNVRIFNLSFEIGLRLNL